MELHGPVLTTIIKVRTIVRHKKYRSKTMDCDIAILTLAQSVVFTERIKVKKKLVKTVLSPHLPTHTHTHTHTHTQPFAFDFDTCAVNQLYRVCKSGVRRNSRFP